MKKIFLSLIILIFSFNADAFYKHSFRRCMVLPVEDAVGGAIGFGVFQEIEKYLKNSEWCFYKTNSEILNILSHYRKNLNDHLNNPEVLAILADKTKSGSIIKVKLTRDMKKFIVELKIFASNGSDIIYRNKSFAENDSIEVISQIIKNWLDIYKTTIPYEGRVIGVLGNQFTMDIGKALGAYPKGKINIVRPIQRKKHPLLKEVVNFQTRDIADGIIFHVNQGQSVGNVKVYMGKNQVQVGDWVVLDKKDQGMIKTEGGFADPKKYSFGKLGQVSVGLGLGSGSATIEGDNTDLVKIGGVVYGINVRSELWITRYLWAGIDIEKYFGSYGEKEGTVSLDSNGADPGKTRIKVAYKYLPLGFFYGPQIDAYLGYKNVSYGFDSSDGFTSFSISGILAGVRGNIPLHKLLRMYLSLEFLISADYAEDTDNLGVADSASNYEIELGAIYNLQPNMKIQGFFTINDAEATFRNPTTVMSVKETGIGGNVLFNF